MEDKYIKYDYIKSQFEQARCKLLERKYIDSSTPMRYICDCGRESKTTWSRFSRGKRCKACGLQKQRRTGESHYRWNPNREIVELNCKVRKRCKDLVRRSLREFKLTKNDRTEKLLGYKTSDLKARLMLHPNWEKVKFQKWEVDHVFPVKAFIDNGF